MKRDFDRSIQDLQKNSLKVKGQEFVLDAQMKIINDQSKKLKQKEGDFMDKMREEQGNLTQTNRENTKIQINLEGDCRSLSNHVESSESTHLEHKLHQDKEKAFDEENKARHDLEVKLVTDLKTRKTEEKNKLQADLD